jgi:hypothetical protein
MRAPLFLVLAACNPVFGIEHTQHELTDAPPTCPPLGTAPQFSREFQQAVFADCHNYTTSEVGTALATCSMYTPKGAHDNYEAGAINSPLTPVVLDPTAGYTGLAPPLLAPEGDVLFVQQTNQSPAAHVFSLFHSDSGGSWSWLADTKIANGIGATSPVTRGPERHVLVTQTGDLGLHEYAGTDTGAWTEILPPYTQADLGTIANYATLTADGLRIVFSDSDSVHYADRPSIDARFGAPVVLPAVPVTDDLFMTEDCSRLYMSGLGDVLYLNQGSN